MKRCSPLVDLAELQKLMADAELKDKRLSEYINARWLKYVDWWDCRSRQAKTKYEWLRRTVVVGGASIPALVGLRELPQMATHAWMFSIASIVVSLAVAICSGLEALGGYGDIWREKRQAGELLKSEGFSFLQLSGKYATFKDHQEAQKLFSESVEELIRREIKDYMGAVSSKPFDGEQTS